MERWNGTYSIGEILQKQFSMSERQARELPKIDIGNTKFYLDLRLNEFREMEDFSNRISLNKLEEFDDGYLIIFDTVSKNIFNGSEAELYKRKDEDLLWVTLPSIEQMDPLGFKWLIDEYRQGTAIAVNQQESKAFREYESNKLEKVLDNAGLLYRPKQHPPLLQKRQNNKSKGKKL
jgi:hypothetical protein